MRKHKGIIINFLVSRNHCAYEFNGMVWALINGIKTEWNWAEGSIIIGFGNDDTDIIKLISSIPRKFTTTKTTHVRNGTNVIFINKGKSIPQNFDEVVRFVELLSFKLVKKAKPQFKKAIEVHCPEELKGQIGAQTIKAHETKQKKNKENKGIRDEAYVQLTLDEIVILNSLCGTGDMLNSKILFFGDEEGCDRGRELEEINKRKYNFYNDYHIVDGKDKLNGHYYFDTSDNIYPNDSTFLDHQSRLLLFLNNPKGNWFDLQPKDPKSFDTIRKYTKHNLHREIIGIKSGLFELRPLMRKSEDSWPYAPGILIRQEYEKVFSFNAKKKSDAFHEQLRDRRIEIISNLLTFSSANTIIGVGNRDFKLAAIKQIFPKIKHHSLKLNEVECYFLELTINNRKIRFYLCPFFENRGGGVTKLKDLRELGRIVLKKGI